VKTRRQRLFAFKLLRREYAAGIPRFESDLPSQPVRSLTPHERMALETPRYRGVSHIRLVLSVWKYVTEG